MNRFDRATYLQTLDPISDNCEICHLLAGYEFPWDITRALEIALFRTFCIPSVAQLLDRTGEFQHRSQKRYDDTGLLVASIMKWGHNSDRGREAIARMNHIHSYFPIANSDYIYVLSTFIYEPIRWIDRFGWRKLSETEKQGLFHFWYAVGERMGIQEIPTTSSAFEPYKQAYEQTHFQYNEASHRVGLATLELFLSWFPAVLRSSLRPLSCAILDEAMLDAVGFAHPTPTQRRWVEQGLQLRSRVQRFLPSRSQPDFYTEAHHRSYPKGYSMEQLGPPHLLSKLNQKP